MTVDDFMRVIGARKPEPPPEPDKIGVSDFVAPTAIAGGTALTYSGSKALDRHLQGAGIATKMPGAKWGDVARFIRAALSRSSGDAVARYAQVSSDFLNREIASGVSGLELIRRMGNSIHSAGSRLGKNVQYTGRLASFLRRAGSMLRAEAGSPHFNGFPTSVDGLNTLLNENAHLGELSLDNMGRVAREALNGNGWRSNRRAARSFDRKFRGILRDAYGYRPLPNSTGDIKPILDELVRTHAPGTDQKTIAMSLMPNTDTGKSVYEAVKPMLAGKGSAAEAVAAMRKVPSGRMALMATAGTVRPNAVTHAAQLAGLNILKALRSGKFRGGAGAAGAVGTAALLYSLLKRGKTS